MAVLSSDDRKLIRESLNGELNILKTKIRMVEKEIRDFEKKYGIKSEEFFKDFEGLLRDSKHWKMKLRLRRVLTIVDF